jgi:antitoxin component of MazEF toxin-antitoxin module
LVRFYRKLWRSSAGYHGVSLPIEAVAALGLEFGGHVALDVTEGKIIITKTEGAENGRT